MRRRDVLAGLRSIEVAPKRMLSGTSDLPANAPQWLRRSRQSQTADISNQSLLHIWRFVSDHELDRLITKAGEGEEIDNIRRTVRELRRAGADQRPR